MKNKNKPIRNMSYLEARSPKEAIDIHLRSLDELYEKVKINIIKKLLKDFCGEKFSNYFNVLDVGIGGGYWIDFFLRKGARVTGIDTNKLFIEGNREKYPTANFILADAVSIKLRDRFDLIFAKDVIEHIKHDEKFLKNMNSHLKENGLILIVTQNSWSLNYLIDKTINSLKRNKDWCGWDPTHVRFYNKKSLERKLVKTSFKPIKWFSSYYFPYRKLYGRIIFDERFLKPFCLIETLGFYDKFPFNFLGWSIGVIAKKT